MIEIKIKYDGQELTGKIPTSWIQVTFQKWLDLKNTADNPAKTLSVLTGIPEEMIKNSSIVGIEYIMQVLSFLKTDPVQYLPETIEIYPGTSVYKIPKDLSIEQIGQYEDFKKELEEAGTLTLDEQLAKYPLYCAMYAIPFDIGEYDYDKAVTLSKHFFNAPAGEVLAVGHFTLAKWIALKHDTAPYSKKQNSPTRRKLQALKLWVKRMAGNLHFYIWRRKQGLTGENWKG